MQQALIHYSAQKHWLSDFYIFLAIVNILQVKKLFSSHLRTSISVLPSPTTLPAPSLQGNTDAQGQGDQPPSVPVPRGLAECGRVKHPTQD